MSKMSNERIPNDSEDIVDVSVVSDEVHDDAVISSAVLLGGDDSFDEPEVVALAERPPMDDEMDITPMIDMTFLLLIFFILTSKMTGEKTYPVPPAKNGSSVVTKNCVSILVSRGTGDTPIVARGDGTVFSDDPEQQSAEIAEYIQTQLDSGVKTEVLVRAEGNVTAGQLQKVEQAIGDVLEEGKMINIAVAEGSL